MNIWYRLFGGDATGSRERAHSGPIVCFGRHQLQDAIVEGARHSGCVLLFGGRQSGKTTVLRALADASGDAYHRAGTSSIVPVYIDLMQLPYDATPAEFFQLVLNLASAACAQHFATRKILAAGRSGERFRNVEEFRSAMWRLKDSTDADVNFLFLLDEAKRVLSSRFPRGFQDNLFTLMFGGPSGPYSFVFAGAQELYKLSEDSTSPIGSRAAKHLVCNLPCEALSQIIELSQAKISRESLEERTALLYHHTGGHAGLSAALARRFAEVPEAASGELTTLIEAVRIERSELFQMWINKLSQEARTVGDALLVNGNMTVEEMAACLGSAGLPPYRADRAAEELQFTGVAIKDGDSFRSANALYQETARRYVVAERGEVRDQEVWALIREVETGLRQLIRAEFEKKWPGIADTQMRAILGEKAWQDLESTRLRNEKSYAHTTRVVTEVLDCAYLGQLGDLMKSNASWSLFRTLFRDKRELEDILKDVTPVRNDFAHFRVVPERELDRCRLRCEDLLAIIAKSGLSV